MSVDAKFMVYGSQIQKWTDDIQTLGKQCDQLKIERDKLEAQKISFARSYKQVVEENDRLKEENEELREQILGMIEYEENE